jgi:hypothetical protein
MARLGRISWRAGTRPDFKIYSVMRTCSPQYRGRGMEEWLSTRTEHTKRFKFLGRMLRLHLALHNPGRTRLADSWSFDLSFWGKNWKPSEIFMQGDGKGGLKFTTISENGASEINLSPESTKQLTDRL